MAVIEQRKRNVVAVTNNMSFEVSIPDSLDAIGVDLEFGFNVMHDSGTKRSEFLIVVTIKRFLSKN